MRFITRFTVAAVAVAVAVVLAPAPDAAAQELARVYHVSPKNANAFEAALAKHVQDRIDHDDPWSWGVYQVVAGKHTGDFFYRSGGHAWADFDEYDSGFGAEAGLHYQLNVAPLVEHTAMFVTQSDTALSRMPTEAEWPNINLIEVVTYRLEPGEERQFHDLIDRIHEAIVAADWPVRYAWGYTVLGGDGSSMDLAIFNENWAGFEEPEPDFYQMLQEQMGEDEAQEAMEQFGQYLAGSESMVLRWRRDLSVPPVEMREGSADPGANQGGGGD